jgi:anti-sigma B factor antagonist
MEMDETTLDSGVLVLKPRGRVNLVAAPGVRMLLADRVAHGSTRIVVDLAEVPSIDSSGLGALVAGLKTARAAGGDLRLARAAEPVLTVLRLTKVDRVLPVYPDAARAFDDR